MARPFATEIDPVSTAFLLVERLGSNGTPVWAVKWRSVDDQRRRRRPGWGAWMEPDGKKWKPRSGRPPDGYLTEFQARRRVPEFVRRAEAELALERERAAAAAAAPVGSFRALAHAWLEHVRDVGNAKPSTIRDYESLLAEPGTPYARGRGKRIGRVMAAIGSLPVDEITAAHVEAMLVAHSKEGVGARSVNKHRQVLAAIFNYALRPENVDHWGLTRNPASATVKRKERARRASRSSPSSRSSPWPAWRSPARGATRRWRRPRTHRSTPPRTPSSPS